jgi:hypothetical protein
MLKAGALYLVLGLSMLLSIITGSVLFLSYNQRTLIHQVYNSENLIRNANSAVNYYFAKPQEFELGKSKTIDLFGYAKDSVVMQLSNWGIYNALSCKSFIGNKQYCKSALLGIESNIKKEPSFFVCDLDRPISICGNTLINGDVLWPKAGYKPAFIEGESFRGEKPYTGTAKEAPAIFPEFNDLVCDIENTLLKQTAFKKVNINEVGDSLINPFHLEAILIEQAGNLVLENKFVAGKIIFKSNEAITIKGSLQFSDVIFLAPKIFIEEGSTGSGQFIATDSLYLGKNCNLNYPSVLAVINKEELKAPTLMIDENTVVKGLVLGASKATNKWAYLSIKNNCKIWGRVVSNGYADVKGKVIGSLYTYKTILKTNSAVYENHLLNTIINPQLLSESFVNVRVFKTENNNPALLKWLN